MEIESRTDMRDMFVKNMKKSTNKLRSWLKNQSAEDRIHLFQTLDIDYDEKDNAGSIEKLVGYMKNGYPKNQEEKEKENTMQTIEDAYQVVENPDELKVTIDPKLEDMYPKMGETTYSKTKESIKNNGMRNPIVITPEGKLIDGHHRYSIWKELYGEGVQLPLKYQIKVFASDEDIETYIKDMNEHRRHLSITEASLEAAREYLSAKDKGDKKPLREVAEKHDVSLGMVHAAKEVLESEDEEIKEAVETGQKHPAAAVKELKAKAAKAAKISKTIEDVISEDDEEPEETKVVSIKPQKKRESREDVKVEAYKTVRETYFFGLMDKYTVNTEEEVLKNADEFEKEFIESLNNFIANPA